ncbi:MAG: 4-hydroxy-tetrahydrodipicolinate synthase [Lentisphaerae bacterium]|jgi:4-hydroxy-tetrahydrodipicolinate synthase|nr:4-hydroxy-tetrahydrodipicolinate synthase [Lentisphaerota bacterium]
MLSGTFTAIVTPFDSYGAVDYNCLCELVEWQVVSGVEGIVPVGTTGESPTLEWEEHLKVIERVVKCADGRVKVIAGTGANSTAEALYLTKSVQSMGVDATLQVTPYYNKPNQEGLYRHFATIADLGLPVVLYNVPGRCSREIAIETIVRLAKHPGVAAVKEAGGSVDRVSAILNACDITVLSGDDSLAVPMISVGAAGLISVASNILPGEVSAMVRAAISGDFVAASAAHRRLYPLFHDLFIDTNPIPVKTALAMMGRIGEEFRLPLCGTSEAIREQLAKTLRALGVVE